MEKPQPSDIYGLVYEFLVQNSLGKAAKAFLKETGSVRAESGGAGTHSLHAAPCLTLPPQKQEDLTSFEDESLMGVYAAYLAAKTSKSVLPRCDATGG